MNDDLIARIIAGPGSRELDAEIFAECKLWAQYFEVMESRAFTTSIDAALGLAVRLVGAEKARYVLSKIVRHWPVSESGQDYLEALPRYICAETLKARTE